MSGNAFAHMADKEAEFYMAWLKGYALGMPSLHVEAFTVSRLCIKLIIQAHL